MGERGIYRIEGEVQPLVLGRGLSASLDPDGGVNTRRAFQRTRYDKVLRGELISGTLVGTYIINTDRPPSWTQYEAGKLHGFVIMALSSSFDAVNWNTFVSGS